MQDGEEVAEAGEKDPYFVAIYPVNADDISGEAERGTLVELVEDVAEPSSWESSEATVHALPGRLVVRQRLSVQKKIYELVTQLQLLDGGGAF